MQAYARAAALYSSGSPGRYPWNDVVSFHLHYGAVVSRPEAFLLVRPVISSEPGGHDILTPLQSPELADCWHVWLAVGNLGDSIRMAALDPLPYVSWYRRERLRIYPLKSLLARHDQAENASSSAAAAPACLIHRPRA